MSLTNKTSLNFFWSLLQQFSTQIIGFVVTVIMTRLLLPSEYGLMGMIYIFISIGTVLLEGGLTQSLIRTSDVDDEDFSSVFIINLLGGIIIYSLIFFLAPFIAEFYNQEVLTNIIRVYGVVVIISAFTAVQNAILIKKMLFKKQLIINLPSLILSSFLGIYLAYNGFGVWSIVWSGIAKSTFLSIQLWVFSDWKIKLIFNKAKVLNHFKFGYKIALMEILNAIFANIYQIFIGKNYTPQKVGYFTQANTLKQIPVSNIYGAINNVAFPLFSSLQNDDEKMLSSYKKTLLIMVYFITPILVFLSVITEPVLSFLFTDKWLPAAPYLKILCYAGILHPLVSFNMNIVKVKGRSDWFLMLGIVNKAFILIALLFLYKKIETLLWGQVLAFFCSFLFNAYFLSKLITYSIKKQILDLLPVFVISALMGVSLYFLDTHLLFKLQNNFLRILLNVFAGIIIYGGGTLLFKLKELEYLKSIILKKSF